jgi:hypothetical protein
MNNTHTERSVQTVILDIEIVVPEGDGFPESRKLLHSYSCDSGFEALEQQILALCDEITTDEPTISAHSVPDSVQPSDIFVVANTYRFTINDEVYVFAQNRLV